MKPSPWRADPVAEGQAAPAQATPAPVKTKPAPLPRADVQSVLYQKKKK